MKIRVMSDLHLDGSSMDVDLDGVDVLIIAGDLSVYPMLGVDWIERKVPRETTVLFVPGNHEYEGAELHAQEELLRKEYSSLPNVVYMQNDEYIRDGVRFLGSTLWSDFGGFPQYGTRDDLMKAARFGISDFSTIRIVEDGVRRGLEPKDLVAMHKKARVFLSSTLLKPFDGETVVITHFAPSPRCIHPKYLGQQVNAYFASNMEEMMSNVDVWVHGHTHQSVDLTIGKTRVVCNPRGYSRKFNIAENQEWSGTFDLEMGFKKTNSLTKHKGP